MMLIYDYCIKFNDMLSDHVGVWVASRPNIPIAEENITYYDVQGRDGELHRKEGTVNDINIPVSFFFIIRDEREMEERRQAVMRWLDFEDNRLFFNYNAEWFYKVKSVSVSTFERRGPKVVLFTVTFNCEGYIYCMEGTEEKILTSGNAIDNIYSLSHPVYKITGEGMLTLTVNGKSVRANVGQNLTIDTELMIAYRVDGTMMNTSIIGDYSNLYLKPGLNMISFSSGFTVKMVPNWRAR